MREIAIKTYGEKEHPWGAIKVGSRCNGFTVSLHLPLTGTQNPLHFYVDYLDSFDILGFKK